MAKPQPRREFELIDHATGELHDLREKDDNRRRKTHNFGGSRHGQFSFDAVMTMIEYGAGLTGDDLKVFFYCAIKTYTEGGATAKAAADHIGITSQAARRIAKRLSEHRIFLVAETVGRTIKYRASPHIVSSLSGEEQAEEAAAYLLPTVPGRAPKKKDTPDGPKPVPRTRRAPRADK